MKFPLWQYLSQLLLNTSKPVIISPAKYWHFHGTEHLEDCLNNDFLEACWNCDYNEFVKQYRHLVDRHYWEEDSSAHKELCDYCWRLDYYRFRRYKSPHYLEEKLSDF